MRGLKRYSHHVVAIFAIILVLALLISAAQSFLAIQQMMPRADIVRGAGSTTRYLPLMLSQRFDLQLPIPDRLTVEQDDRNAIVQWDGGPPRPDRSLPANVMGYRVVWGPAEQPDANIKLTEEPILQLQPLENGKPYVVQVQSVSSLGTLSLASKPLRFTGNSARVDALRTRMNGFFDDFNLPEGAPDERKWNSAYSRCNAASSNGFFINGQFHAHNTLFSGNCDRGQSISRPRATLDFSDNLTRTIVFDFDGEFRRDQWYLDIVPRPMDISGQINIESGLGSPADPANGLRIHQGEQGVEIIAFTATGDEEKLAGMDFNPYAPLDWIDLKLVSNVRRHWEIRMRRDAMEILINGQLVLATKLGAFHLPEEHYTLLWNVFSYNTDKSNEPFVLTHWDNFGFDAPASTTHDTVTHNYRLINSGTDIIHVFAQDNSSPTTRTLSIPDPVGGAQARRLIFTLQMDENNAYQWANTDTVSINGHAFAIPQPTTNTLPPLSLDRLVSTISPYTVIIPLPDGVVQQGQNTLAFSTIASSIHNIHLELDFPASSEPAYTPPSQAITGTVMPEMPAIGPNAIITRIGTRELETYADYLNDASRFNPVVSGTIPIEIEVHSDIALHGTGSTPGVVQVELLIDGSVLAQQRTDAASPAPAVKHTFNLDTRQLTDGVHEIYLRAYNPACVPSIADYGGAGSESGRYYPIHITVHNGIAIPLTLPKIDLSAAICQAHGTQALVDHQH